MSSPPKPLWAVVPLKAMARAKGRLSPALSPVDRERLTLAMTDDVLGAIHASRVADRICLLSDQHSPATAELAARHGAVTLLDREVANEPGLNAAIAGMAMWVSTCGGGPLLVVHSDLPLLTSETLRQLLQAWRALRGTRRVALARSKDGGTGLLLTEHPRAFTYRFGPDSYALHVDECRRRGCTTAVAELAPELLDIDTPDDLDRLRFAAQAGHCGQRTAAIIGGLAPHKLLHTMESSA